MKDAFIKVELTYNYTLMHVRIFAVAEKISHIRKKNCRRHENFFTLKNSKKKRERENH